MLFLQGSEVIFKVALSLLGSHKPLILQHENLESIVEFIKTTLPNLGLVQMEKTINQVTSLSVLLCNVHYTCIPKRCPIGIYTYALSLALCQGGSAFGCGFYLCFCGDSNIRVSFSTQSTHTRIRVCPVFISSYVVLHKY